MKGIQESATGRLMVLVMICAAIGLLAGCGPSVKSCVVDMRYLYSGVPDGPDGRESYTINVARFRDGRMVADKRAMGTVDAPWWNEAVPIVPRAGMPADIVTDSVKAQLYKNGFTLSGPAPVWNLEEKTLDKAWGRYVPGGVIEELFVAGKNDPPVSYNDASVRITFVLGNTETGMVKRFTQEKEGYQTLVSINAGDLERQINSVLSQAIAEGLYEDRVRAALREVSRGAPAR
jgi:hypothetical protein